MATGAGVDKYYRGFRIDRKMAKSAEVGERFYLSNVSKNVYYTNSKRQQCRIVYETPEPMLKIGPYLSKMFPDDLNTTERDRLDNLG